MTISASYKKLTLQFKFDAGTSRGVLKEKDSWFIKIKDNKNPLVYGIGEAAPLKGLSIDYVPDFEEKLKEVCSLIAATSSLDAWRQTIAELHLQDYPSIVFALETAFLDLVNGGRRIIFDTVFSRGEQSIPINGLVWMGEKAFMQKQIEEKLRAGFSCIKIKVGAIDFETELLLIKEIRNRFSEKDISIRLDANGAFNIKEAPGKLHELSKYKIHSIEQPIQQGQPEAMAELCSSSPIPIALDEELIGVKTKEDKIELLDIINPPFIILKPTLLGGINSSREWIELAEARSIKWWFTSALESNIGLNAIAELTSCYPVTIPQGLGTGQIFHNNIESSLVVSLGAINKSPLREWDLNAVDKL